MYRPSPTPRTTLLLLLGLITLVYLPVLRAGWVWDDRGLVLHNTAVLHPTFTDVFARDLWCCTDGDPTAWFRPLMTVSLILDHHVLGGSPMAAHLHSLAWHLLCVAGVYRLTRDRLGSEAAALAGLWFGLHPLQSEAVAWVAARNDLLATAAVLGALSALNRGRSLVVSLCTLAALLAKESAVLLLPIAAVWAWGGRQRLSGKDTLALVAALVVWALIRAGATLGDVVVPPLPEDLVATVARVGALGWSWWTVPWPLTATASVSLPHLTPLSLLGATLSTALLGITVWGGGRPAIAGWGIAALGLLPGAAGVVTYGTLGERYFYLPMFGVAHAVSAAVCARSLATHARPTRVATALLGGGAAALLAVRLPDWRSDATLFEAAWTRAPDAYSAWHLGSIRVGQGRGVEGLALLERSLTMEVPATHACRTVADTARRILGPDDFLAHVPVWTGAGCRKLVGFDGPVATQLTAWGRWEDARAWLAANTQPDASGRLHVARAALCAHDGDVLGQAAVEAEWTGEPAQLRDRVATLLAGSTIR